MNKGKYRSDTTEKELREQIRDLAQFLGWRFYFTWTSMHSPRGMPDLILCRPPRLIFAELKTDKRKSKLSPEQARWLWELRRVPGVEVYVFRPRQLERIVKILR